ncbi:MAG: hypothetical protein JW709_07090 [Sedimentisphaerales bacterium]|nr:hypothetical protein [Sedimentisphaerales bacterium]
MNIKPPVLRSAAVIFQHPQSINHPPKSDKQKRQSQYTPMPESPYLTPPSCYLVARSSGEFTPEHPNLTPLSGYLIAQSSEVFAPESPGLTVPSSYLVARSSEKFTLEHPNVTSPADPSIEAARPLLTAYYRTIKPCHLFTTPEIPPRN